MQVDTHALNRHAEEHSSCSNVQWVANGALKLPYTTQAYSGILKHCPLYLACSKKVACSRLESDACTGRFSFIICFEQARLCSVFFAEFSETCRKKVCIPGDVQHLQAVCAVKLLELKCTSTGLSTRRSSELTWEQFPSILIHFIRFFWIILIFFA